MEVKAEKRIVEGISGADMKWQQRQGTRGKDFKRIFTSSKKKIGARVTIRAKHFGLKWAQEAFPYDGGNKVLVGTICCNTYQKQK